MIREIKVYQLCFEYIYLLFVFNLQSTIFHNSQILLILPPKTLYRKSSIGSPTDLVVAYL